MKINKAYFFLAFMILVLIGLSWFSLQRNQVREKQNILVDFTQSPRFLDTISVNKMLTQYWSAKSVQEKDSLDLDMLEDKLKSVDVIENAEVFMLHEGDLAVSITERIPTFIIESTPPLFGDAKGAVFPYVAIEDLELPVFKTDNSSFTFVSTARLIEKLKLDSFISTELETLYLEGSTYKMQLKSYPFEVVLGSPSLLNEKIEKLKVFCAFQNVQDSLSGYKKINLTYLNQVVAITP